jgi:hypothetical protein
MDDKAVIALIAALMEEGSIAVSFLKIKNLLRIERKDEGKLRRLLEEMSCSGGSLVKAGDTLYALTSATLHRLGTKLPLSSEVLCQPASKPVSARKKYRSLRPGAGLD